jgi:4-hydroxy-tetrahydrodipicolinate synthase
VMTFQRLAAVVQRPPDKLLITGEDRFLGYSLMLGARAALVGMGAALPALLAGLLRACAEADWPAVHVRSALCDRLAMATFTPPMEAYVRRMLWAAAADGALPADACDDPWGPPLPADERATVERVVREVREHDARPAHA